MAHNSKLRGFTLIELMVVVVVLGILASIAIPAYTAYVIRAHRATAQGFMLDLAQLQEQYLLDNRQYATQLAAGIGGLGMTMPADVATDYAAPNFNVNNGATPPSFALSMTPIAGGRMNGDGVLTIDNTGQKSRDVGSDHLPW